MAKAILFVVLAVAMLYAAAIALLWWRQESLLFFPEVLAADHRLATEPDVHEVTVEVPGARLSMLHLKLPDPKGVVFYLHGNGGSLASWFTNTAFYREAGFDLVMPDYRGYGKSTGRIESLAQLRGDVRAAWNSVAAQYRGKRIVVFGRSLGTGLAADLAAQLTAEASQPHLIVLVSPYTSMRELTSELYPWVPPQVLRYPLDTVTHLSRTGAPILLMHGARDTLIRVHHAERLRARAPAAQLLVVPEAGHNDVHQFDSYRQVLRAALARL